MIKSFIYSNMKNVYNHEKADKKYFWCKVHISVEDDFETPDARLQFEVFEGGQYAYEEVEWNNNCKRWFQFIDWVKMSRKNDFDNRPFMEEFIIDSPALSQLQGLSTLCL